MTDKDNGGPAFPAHDYIVGNIQKDGFQKLGETRGMTLRDYFAAKATEEDIRANMVVGMSYSDPEDRAIARFLHADAMLKERSK